MSFNVDVIHYYKQKEQQNIGYVQLLRSDWHQ